MKNFKRTATHFFLAIILTHSFIMKAQKKEYFYDNGNLQSVGNLIDGELDGEWKTYYESGKLQTIKHFTKGKRTGELKAFYENGQLNALVHFVDDAQSGKFQFYNEDGTLAREGLWENGLQTG